MSNITIGISDLKACRAPDVLVTYALGSCVGICLIDSVAGVGGLSHIMLPDSSGMSNAGSMPMRFADTAIPLLVQKMSLMGANKGRMKAKIAGGAVMFATSNDKFNIGERNVHAVRAALNQLRIPIIAEDTGLDYGRIVFFYPETGIMEVKAATRSTKRL